jgi:DNA-directed RNA polymerase specialized sigma24 family protein
MTGFEYVLDLIRTAFAAARFYWRQWVPVLPLLALLWAGWEGTTIAGYVDLTLLLVMSVLVCNPFCVLSGVLAPASRGAITAAILTSMAAVQRPHLELYCRSVFLLMSGLVLGLVWKCNTNWLLNWKVRQSPQVNKVLSQLTRGGDALEAADAWERFGARETRALLRQSLSLECPEKLVVSGYAAVYQLAFLHGSRWAEREVRKLKKQLKEKVSLDWAKGASIAEYQAMTERNNALESAVERLTQEKEQLQARCEELQDLPVELVARVEEAEKPAPVVPEPTPLDRDKALIEYVEAGHSYAEAGERFGLSKSGAAAVVRRVRQKQKQEEQEELKTAV